MSDAHVMDTNPSLSATGKTRKGSILSSPNLTQKGRFHTQARTSQRSFDATSAHQSVISRKLARRLAVGRKLRLDECQLMNS